MNKHIKGWEKEGLDETNWVKARTIGPGVTKDGAVNSTGWMLVPSSLPQMEMSMQRLAATRKAAGIQLPETFPKEKTKVTIPANIKATLLLDHGFLTNAYPTIQRSGGKNVSISMGYTEGLYIGKKEDLKGFRFFQKETAMKSMGKFLLAELTA